MLHNYYRDWRRRIEDDYRRQLGILREEIRDVEGLEEELNQIAHRNTILFQYDFNNIQILSPMNVSKVIGPVSGTLVFKNAEGQIQPITGLKNVALSVNDAAIGNAKLGVDANGNPDGTWSGNGVAAGDLIVTAGGLNDAGNQVSGSSTITFHADTTVTEVDVNVN